MKVYFSHATSFCGAVWDPVRDRLGDAETEAWDHPGHGQGPAVDAPIHWSVFGEHVLSVTQPGGIGVGHSMGAAALVMAQAADPARFRALVLIEPVMYPGPRLREDNSLAEKALRRRREFDSREEAADNFRDRGAFVGWDETAFAGYIADGLVGEGPVRLACAPEVEAEIYRGSRDHGAWDDAGDVEVPVLVISGALSEPVPPTLARQQAGLFPRAGLEIVPAADHFLPMQLPELVAGRVRRFVDTIAELA